MEKDIKQYLGKKSSVIYKLKSLTFFKTKRRTIATIAALVVLGFFGWKMLKGNTKPVQYQTAKVERGTLISTVTASGIVTSSSSVPVTTSATGTIDMIYVKNGDSVNKGDTIATLIPDSSSLHKQTATWASYLSSRNLLNGAKAKMNSLQSALFVANQKFVNDRGVPNPSADQKNDPAYIEENATWLAAEADYNNQQGAIAQAEAALSNAWLLYSQVSSTITAPIGGIVSDLSVDAGAVIIGQNTVNSTANSTSYSQKIAAIKTNAAPTVGISLSEIDVPKVKLGNKATITLDAIPGKTFTGKIVGIDTSGVVNSGVTNYPVIIVLDTQAPDIFTNMSVSSNIIIDTKSDILIVPSTAIQVQEDQSFVKILKNGVVQEISVETGITSDTQTEITSGLNEGLEVITGTVAVRQNNSGQSASPFGAGVLRPGGFGGGGRSGR